MRIRFFFAAFLAVLSLSQLSAQSSDLPFVRGIYFAGSGHFSTINGEFDGQSVGLLGTEIFALPRLHAGFGAGGLLGYRGANWAYEAGGFYKANSSSLGSIAFDTSTMGFTFDVEWLPFARTNLQPYLTAGVGVSTLTVEDGSADGSLVGDALYYLGGFRAGLGIEVCVTKKFFVRLQGIYRIERVVGIQGVNDGERKDLKKSVNADGWEFSLIIGYIVL
jgi:hypothetical protein